MKENVQTIAMGIHAICRLLNGKNFDRDSIGGIKYAMNRKMPIIIMKYK
jgi:hypothetical protein